MSLFGMYVAVGLAPSIGIVPAFLVGAAVAVAIGLVVREALIRPLGPGRPFPALIITLGVSLILEEMISEIWGSTPRSFPDFISGTTKVGSVYIRNQDMLTIVLAALAVGGVSYLFARTPLGSAMRAVAESPNTARLIGVNDRSIARVAWTLGTALAALGVALYVGPTGLTPTIALPAIFRALSGILLGGLTSMEGAVIGGLVIGVLDNVAATYISASLRDTFVFAVAIVVLVARPQGMFGRRSFARV
jgi:branched-chain amino acid transport system permease protein